MSAETGATHGISSVDGRRIVTDVVSDASAYALLIPTDDNPIDWRQCLEIAVTRAAGEIDLKAFVEHAKSSALARVGDATHTFAFEVLAHEPARVVHA